MAIKDLLGFIDDKLEAVFHTKALDPAKLRAPVLKGIERTERQWTAPEPAKGVKWFRTANDAVAFTPTLSGGKIIQINGRDTNFIPSERFKVFLAAFRTAVESGEFDAEINAGGVGSARVKAPKSKTEGRGGRGWTEERRQKFAETMAERKAAKG